jgi:hypothetical protein
MIIKKYDKNMAEYSTSQELKELLKNGKTLKKGDVVIFPVVIQPAVKQKLGSKTLDELKNLKEIRLSVEESIFRNTYFLFHEKYKNRIVFMLLGLNADKFAARIYGYSYGGKSDKISSRKPDFPEARNLTDLTRISLALMEKCEKLKDKLEDMKKKEIKDLIEFL